MKVHKKWSTGLLAALALLASHPAIAGSATVVVPGKATGGFGNPASGYVPLIHALTVTQKGTITIAYRSGTVGNSGPKGISYTLQPNWQLPLQEKAGTAGGKVANQDALIGAFVPESIMKATEFSPVDGSKGLAEIGIPPSELFFVGAYTTVDVNGPGTLYLGINDSIADDNVGGFTVRVTGP